MGSKAGRRKKPEEKPRVTARSRRLRVLDPKGLGGWLQSLMDEAGLSQRSFAAAHSISQSTLSRLVRGESNEIEPATYHQLWWSLQNRGSELEKFFFTEEGEAIKAMYRDWLFRSEESVEARLGLTLGERRRLADLIEIRSDIKKLDSLIERRGYGDYRRLAALRSVLQPLNRFYTTLGMERGMSELSGEELAAFVVWGLKRECLLLERESDDRRAQQPRARRRELRQRLDSPDLGDTSAFYSWDFERGEAMYATVKRLEPRTNDVA